MQLARAEPGLLQPLAWKVPVVWKFRVRQASEVLALVLLQQQPREAPVLWRLQERQVLPQELWVALPWKQGPTLEQVEWRQVVCLDPLSAARFSEQQVVQPH